MVKSERIVVKKVTCCWMTQRISSIFDGRHFERIPMSKNSPTSRLRSKTSSLLLASSVAIASIAVAGLTESPVNAAPVSYGNILAGRAVASNGTFKAYGGEELVLTATASINFSQDPACHGVSLQSGDVVTMTESNFGGFVGNFYFDASGVNTQALSYTLPDPLPTYLNINTPQIRVTQTSGTLTFLPKLKVTRGGNVLVETTNCVSPSVTATIDNGLQYDLSSYVAREGDQ